MEQFLSFAYNFSSDVNSYIGMAIGVFFTGFVRSMGRATLRLIKKGASKIKG